MNRTAMARGLLMCLAACIISCSSSPEFRTFPKIDAHVHLETYDESFVKVIRQNHMKLITLVTRSNPQHEILEEYKYAKKLHDHHPDQIGFATTFSMDGFGEPGWEKRTLEWLEQCFDDGAIALKVWKDIGMTFRDTSGAFILIDDPRFDPIFNYVESRGKTLVNHNAEPKNCWLPLNEMTVKGDSSYFAENPQYHMYLHPEYPSYEELIAARDRMLAKHPGLRYVGCHLGSQEWDVEVLANSLDQFPNMSVDMAARIPHFKIQDRDKVRDFIIQYQDRLLYGTDIGIRGDGEPGWSTEQARRILEETWLSDWEYFTTDQLFIQNDKVKEFRGLDLPLPVLEKIYDKNARRIYELAP
jgi:predicted TIM-barrel fold metal-dependent hydrolase